jgi:integrase
LLSEWQALVDPIARKGGKQHEVLAHHNAEAYLVAYLGSAGIMHEKRVPLSRSVDRHRQLTTRLMTRTDVLRMTKLRALDAGLPTSTCCYTFRATGITAYLSNGDTIENAQAIATDESPRTTKVYVARATRSRWTKGENCNLARADSAPGSGQIQSYPESL